jgi:hypothetical protein
MPKAPERRTLIQALLECEFTPDGRALTAASLEQWDTRQLLVTLCALLGRAIATYDLPC